MNTVCHWDNDHAVRLVHNKKAIEAAIYISFIGYTAAVILSEVKRGTKIGANMKRFVNDVAFSQLFFFICAICVDILVPGTFMVILVYVYMLTHVIQAVGYAL